MSPAEGDKGEAEATGMLIDAYDAVAEAVVSFPLATEAPAFIV
jgi:hypothetical protein